MIDGVSDVSLAGNILNGSVSLLCPKDYAWERKQIISIYNVASDVEAPVRCMPYFSPNDGQIKVESLSAFKIR